MSETKLGAIQDSFDTYLSRKDCLSSSDIATLLRSPYEYFNPVPQATEPAHYKIGSAVHCAVIEPAEYLKRYCLFPEHSRPETDKGMTSNKNKAWKQWTVDKHKNAGIYFITEKEQETIAKYKKSVETNPEAMRIMAECTKFETSYYAQLNYGDTIFNARCRPDMMGNKHYVSIKTTKNPEPPRFYSEAAKYEYQAKEAFYWTVLNAVRKSMGLRPLENGYIIAIGTDATAVYELNPEFVRNNEGLSPFIADGMHLIHIAIQRWKKARSTGVIPGWEINHNGLFTFPMQTPVWKQNEIEILIQQNAEV